MTSFDKLQQLFTELPGIGPRQARRFATFFVRKNESYVTQLMSTLKDAREHMRLCTESFQLFYATDPKQTVSPIERDPNRDRSLLLVVEKDVDVDQIERSGNYQGCYFVIDGTVPFTDVDPEKYVRLTELVTAIKKRASSGLSEIILGLSATPEGEHTSVILKTRLQPILEDHPLTISTLGRGLSTGTELEYSDEETIKDALQNRH